MRQRSIKVLMETQIVSKEEFDKVIEGVLASKEYQYIPSKIEAFVEGIKEAILEWVESLLEGRIDTSGTSQLPQAVSIILALIVLIAGIAILALLIKYIYKCRSNRKKLHEILGEQISEETTPLTLLEKGEGYAVNGDYRIGIRYRYIALLLLLHEEGVLHIRNAMTNQEIYNALEKKQYNHLESFSRVMTSFEYIWYGQNDYTKEQYEQYKLEEQSLWKEVTSHGKA